MYKISSYFLLSYLFITLTIPTTILGRRKGKLSPVTIKLIKENSKSFKKCRKDALSNYRDKITSKAEFKTALNICKESFPGANIYITCKKKALKLGKDKKAEVKKALKKCKRFKLATSFNPESLTPFFHYKSKTYFGAIGLNKTLPADKLIPPNFDCSPIKSALDDVNKAQYFLFGNHPKVFKGLDQLNKKDLIKFLRANKVNSKEKGSTIIKGFGKLYGSIKSKNSVIFLPTATCNFNKQIGKTYSGMSIYYLLDSEQKAVTPYFGIAYYKRKVSKQQVIKKALKIMGKKFRVFAKDKQVSFIAEHPFSEIDDESDPKNLCKNPRLNKTVITIQSKKNDKKTAEYIIVANIASLCKFGDTISEKLLNNNSK